jgi:hypothetical protein
VLAKQQLLATRCLTRADDADRVFLGLDVDDYNEPTRDRADGDESVFGFRVIHIEYLEVIAA